jgi:hypothetical protein
LKSVLSSAAELGLGWPDGSRFQNHFIVRGETFVVVPTPLQDRILLLFKGRSSWTCGEMARRLTAPEFMVKDRVRTMAMKGWFNTRAEGGDDVVDITREGKTALAEILKTDTR